MGFAAGCGPKPVKASPPKLVAAAQPPAALRFHNIFWLHRCLVDPNDGMVAGFCGGTIFRFVNISITYPALLLGSMYFWSWLMQLNRSYKYNENIAHTGISTLNGHISKPVALREKVKKMRINNFSLLGLGRWFQNFMQCVFCHF